MENSKFKIQSSKLEEMFLIYFGIAPEQDLNLHLLEFEPRVLFLSTITLNKLALNKQVGRSTN
ncbi:hypothetical protein SD81_023915 [Tolypothrix campylonemoides VB511288]|nr:hypothetical protein SD81_023915 [Tolypothrix campylonemoides VB511288]